MFQISDFHIDMMHFKKYFFLFYLFNLLEEEKKPLSSFLQERGLVERARKSKEASNSPPSEALKPQTPKKEDPNKVFKRAIHDVALLNGIAKRFRSGSVDAGSQHKVEENSSQIDQMLKYIGKIYFVVLYKIFFIFILFYFSIFQII